MSVQNVVVDGGKNAPKILCGISTVSKNRIK
jgi:hypothetical protein